jgi:hypothetical protein
MKTRDEILTRFIVALNDIRMNSRAYANTDDEAHRIAARVSEERARTLLWTLGDDVLREMMLDDIDNARKLLGLST